MRGVTAAKFLLIFYVDLKAIKAFDPVITNLSIISFTVFAERRVKVDALVSVKW